MINLRPPPSDTSITFANGSKASVEAVGDNVMRVPGSEVDTITLTDVYHVPEAHLNLFSIRSAVRRGVMIEYRQGKHFSTQATSRTKSFKLVICFRVLAEDHSLRN